MLQWLDLVDECGSSFCIEHAALIEIQKAPNTKTVQPGIESFSFPAIDHQHQTTLSSTTGVLAPALTVMRVRYNIGEAGLLPSAFNGFTLLKMTVKESALTVAVA